MIEVWHNEPPDNQREVRRFSDDPMDIVWPDYYVHVATVYSDELGEAWQLTNSIETYWWENEGVLPDPAIHKVGGFRSTSVGDVLDLNGDLWVVASVGFIPMEDIQFERALWDKYRDVFGEDGLDEAMTVWQFYKLTNESASKLAERLNWLTLTGEDVRAVLFRLADLGFPVVARRLK